MDPGTVVFKGRTFVVLGRLDAMTKDEAWLAIRDLGGYTSNTPRPSSDYIVLGKSPGATKFALVAKVGKPTLTEAEFLAAVAAESQRLRAGREEVPINDAIADFRDLVYDEPSGATWDRIMELLDRCAPDALELAVEYVEQHSARWPTASSLGVAEPLPLHHSAPAHDLRVMRGGWLSAILQGDVSPKYRLIREASLHMKLTGAVAARVVENPSLCHLRYLDLGEDNKLPPTFFKKLRESRHLPGLQSLVLRTMTPQIARALCGDHALEGLRYVTLAHPDRYASEAEHQASWEQLFEAGWWSQIEGLGCVVSRGKGAIWPNLSVWPTLSERLDRLPRLRHLMVGDDFGFGRLLDAGVLERIEQLSFYTCDPATGRQAIEALGRGGHTVSHLDVSRVAHTLRSWASVAHASQRQSAYLEALMAQRSLGAVTRVTVHGSLLQDAQRAQVAAWCEERGIALEVVAH